MKEGGHEDRPILPTYVLLTTDEQFAQIVVEFICVPYDKTLNHYPNDFYFKFKSELEQQKECYE